MSFIDNLQLIDKTKNPRKKRRLSLFSILILTLLFSLSACIHQKKSTPAFKLTEDERIVLKEFFRDLLFDKDGAYVLFGTKPVSLSLLQEPATEEEKEKWKAYYDSLSEEDKAQIQMREKRYDFFANYQKWQQIRSRFSIQQYLFGIFRLDEKTEILVFVNIEMTIRTLLKHYEAFKRVLGYDFDIFQIVFDVENKDSKFWNNVIRDHVLTGIILGYGQDNASFFDWWMRYEEAQNQMGNFIRNLPSKFDEDRNIQYPDPQNFPLPIFRSFGLYPDNQLITQYKKEAMKIKELYKGRNEVDVALEWLTR